MEIAVNNVQEKFKLPPDYESLVEKCVSRVYETEGLSGEYEVGITITDDEGIRRLNRDYRDIDAPTDVLSFSLLEHIEEEPEILEEGGEEILMLGDIVVSVEAVERQAGEYGHSVTRELCFLVVHGMLHLLGYDHQTPESEQIMKSRQKKILDDLNICR